MAPAAVHGIPGCRPVVDLVRAPLPLPSLTVLTGRLLEGIRGAAACTTGGSGFVDLAGWHRSRPAAESQSWPRGGGLGVAPEDDGRGGGQGHVRPGLRLGLGLRDSTSVSSAARAAAQAPSLGTTVATGVGFEPVRPRSAPESSASRSCVLVQVESEEAGVERPVNGEVPDQRHNPLADASGADDLLPSPDVGRAAGRAAGARRRQPVARPAWSASRRRPFGAGMADDDRVRCQGRHPQVERRDRPTLRFRLRPGRPRLRARPGRARSRDAQAPPGLSRSDRGRSPPQACAARRRPPSWVGAPGSPAESGRGVSPRDGHIRSGRMARDGRNEDLEALVERAPAD